MNTTTGCAITPRVLLSEADARDEKGEKREAAKIRGWVAELLSEQSDLLRSVLRPVGQTKLSHARCNLLAKGSLHRSER